MPWPRDRSPVWDKWMRSGKQSREENLQMKDGVCDVTDRRPDEQWNASPESMRLN
jgi:hypothetical protein